MDLMDYFRTAVQLAILFIQPTRPHFLSPVTNCPRKKCSDNDKKTAQGNVNVLRQFTFESKSLKKHQCPALSKVHCMSSTRTIENKTPMGKKKGKEMIGKEKKAQVSEIPQEFQLFV